MDYGVGTLWPVLVADGGQPRLVETCPREERYMSAGIRENLSVNERDPGGTVKSKKGKEELKYYRVNR